MTILCRECEEKDCDNPPTKQFGHCNRPCYITPKPLFLISEEEIGELLDVTEDICYAEGWVTLEQVALARKRIDIINRIKSHQYLQPSERCKSCIFGNPKATQTMHVPSVSRNKEGDLTLTFNHDALTQHDAAISHAATLAENKRLLDLVEAFANTSSRLVDLNGECGDESSDVIEADELKSLIEYSRKRDIIGDEQR